VVFSSRVALEFELAYNNDDDCDDDDDFDENDNGRKELIKVLVPVPLPLLLVGFVPVVDDGTIVNPEQGEAIVVNATMTEQHSSNDRVCIF